MSYNRQGAEASVACYRDESGEGHLDIAFRDIIEREQARSASREDERFYRTLIENALDLVVVVGADGAVRYASPSVERIMGYQPEEFVGVALFEHAHPEDLELAMTAFAEAVRNPGVTKGPVIRFRHRDGSWRHMEVISNNLLDDPDVRGVLISSRDVTVDMLAEEKIHQLVKDLKSKVAERTARLEAIVAQVEESEQRFRLTFELAPVGMAHVGLDGRWLRINNKLLEILGYEREELLDLTFQDITHPEDLDADLRYVRQLLSGQTSTYSMEKRYIKKDGSRIWIELNVSLVPGSSDEPEYFISIVEDITERKLAELLPDPLAARELEALRLVACGKTNRQVAQGLKHSVATAKLDVRRVIAKLGASDRHRAAARAVEIGLIPPP